MCDALMVNVTAAHAPVLAVIHAAGDPPNAWSADVFSLQLATPGVFGLLDPAGAYVLARVAADEAEILSIATCPAVQRQGRAAALLHAARVRAAAAGAATLVLEVAVRNAAARALYAAAGFEPVGRRARYYQDGDDALILRVSPCAPPAPPSRPRPTFD